MDTISRGNAAEAAVLHALVAADIPVLIPFGDGLCFDLAAVHPVDGVIFRLQVKSGRIRNECVEFNACGTDHGSGRQHYRGRADLIAVHVSSLDAIFMVPVDDCPSFRGYLRLAPPRNRQRAGVRLAENYEFAAWVSTVRPSSAVETVEHIRTASRG